MTKIKNEMTDEMLDKVVGGKLICIIRPGEKPGTYDASAMDTANPNLKSWNNQPGIRPENLDQYKAARIKMGYEIVMENGV